MEDFNPIPLDIPPGVMSETSEVDNRGRWSAGNNVRFWKGRPERIGGWEKVLDAQYDGIVRGAQGWLSNAGIAHLAGGTATKLEVMTAGVISDISPVGLAAGLVSGTSALGYGVGTYGGGFYGIGQTPSALSVVNAATHARTWSLDNFGEDLIAVARDDGNLYRWVTATGVGTPAAIVAAAPTGNLGVITAEQSQHVLLWGAGGDPLKIEWCSQENINDWVPTDLNTAGGLRCDDGSTIVGAVTTGLGHLILTDTAAYILRYVGLPDVFSLDRVGSNCGLIGPLALSADDNGAIWMSGNAFFQYDGAVNRVTCDVHGDVFDSLNIVQRYKIAAGHNKKFNEVVFFYPDGANEEISNNVSLNSDGWALGDVPRSTWLDEDVVAQYPIGFDLNGQAFLHEYGTLGDGAAIPYSLTLGDTEVTEGKAMVHVRRVALDYKRIVGTHSVTIEVRGWPRKAARTKGPYTLTNTDDVISVRARGRSISMTLTGEDDFRMGLFRAWLTEDGLND